MPFVTVCLTTLLSYAALFLAAKLIGRKQISQLDFMDYITGISIGSIAAELATELETPWKPLTAVILYGLITCLMSYIGRRWMRSRKFLNGTPTILMHNGKLYRDNMKKAKLELSEFMVMCRQQGYFDLSAIRTAIFEYNGTLSILPVTKNRPATPQDMGLSPEQEPMYTEVIMDGRILGENLQRMGLTPDWLHRQLGIQGFSDAKQVFLGVCDPDHRLTCYAMT